MKITYILDTSVIISDPHVYDELSNSTIVVPITVLEELDNLKQTYGDAARNARLAIRYLDELTALSDPSCIQLKNNSILIIDPENYAHSFSDVETNDVKILSCAVHYRQKAVDGEEEVCLLSNDINMKVRSRARGVSSASFDKNKVELNELYSGVKKIVNAQAGYDLQQNHKIDPNMYDIELEQNQCVLFTDESNQGIGIGRKVDNEIKVIRSKEAFGIKPKSKEQVFALDMLMDPKLHLVSLIGMAGSGKSLISCAAGMQAVVENKQYKKLVIYRPIQSVGAEIGYLPGDEQTKLQPYFGAIMDSFEVILSDKSEDDKDNNNKMKNSWQSKLEFYKKKELISFEAMSYIRGRSLNNSYIIIDEAQNISKEDMKTILTRVGYNAKIVLTGDLSQIDNPKLDAMNNGLTVAVNKFKGNYLAGHITLVQGERSALANEAVKLF